MDLARGDLIVHLRVIAYPARPFSAGIELENAGASPTTADATPFTIPIALDDSAPFLHHWMVGGNSAGRSRHDALRRRQPADEQVVAARATHDFMPWTPFTATASQRWLLPRPRVPRQLEPRGRSPRRRSASHHRRPSPTSPPSPSPRRSPHPSARHPRRLRRHPRRHGVRSYDWQYRYLWDYTNADYYARTKWAVPWTYCAQNLQEQFAERLATST